VNKNGYLVGASPAVERRELAEIMALPVAERQARLDARARRGAEVADQVALRKVQDMRTK
jgi:hypothetical protein